MLAGPPSGWRRSRVGRSAPSRPTGGRSAGALQFGDRADEAAYGTVSGAGYLHRMKDSFIRCPRAAGIWSIGDAANTQQSISRLHQHHGPSTPRLAPEQPPSRRRLRLAHLAGRGKSRERAKKARSQQKGES
jgi:hypothetical protein